jgi:hypothetical protein
MTARSNDPGAQNLPCLREVHLCLQRDLAPRAWDGHPGLTELGL